MDQEELLSKLAQIEEQARQTFDAFPTLTKERLRMIIALSRYLRAEVSEVQFVQREKPFTESGDPQPLGM